MMTLRLACTCDRNLLDVQLDRTSNRIDVRTRPGVTDRVEGSTHNVACKCGENWLLPERQLLNWARQRLYTEDSVRGVTRAAGVLRVRLADFR
jgi:hypothetical protein